MAPERYPKLLDEMRFIKVKGRSETQDYWLYVVFHCSSQPEIHVVREPVRVVEHWRVSKKLLKGAES